MIIIGIDWSTDYKKTGIALGLVQSNKVVIKDVKVGSKNERPEEVILGWLRRDRLALLAMRTDTRAFIRVPWIPHMPTPAPVSCALDFSNLLQSISH